MDHRNNNFDLLRLFFASFVIITHSYALTGIKECDFLCQITNGQIVFSYIGLKGFFVISGYLVFQSLQRSSNIVDFYWKRVLRVFPGLFVVLLLTVILTPFVYQSDVPLLQNSSYLTYLPNNILLYRIQLAIDGVFENNPYKSTINGSLWTVQYEFTFYILLSFLFLIRRRKNEILFLLGLSVSILLAGNLFFMDTIKQHFYILSGEYFFDLGLFFASGSFLAALDIEKTKWKKELLVLFSILTLSSFFFNYFSYTALFTFPVLIILLAIHPVPYGHTILKKAGDLSYGIYIYGFPVQQTLMYFFRLNHLELIFFSLLISYLLAYFSWHLVEEKALKLKRVRPLSKA